MKPIAVLFPGQGAQLVGMGKDVAAEFPTARQTFAQADDILGFGLSKFCFEGPADDLMSSTDIQQPAILVTSVAIYRVALECGVIDADQIGAMGGLSLGEYTALHLAGAIEFDDALRLVHRRGQHMQRAADATNGTMVSILGAREEDVLRLCEQVAHAGYVRPANFNCPGQIVVSGDRAACQAIAPLAEEAGFKAVPLAVSGAFHCEHMRSAAEALRDDLDATAIRSPVVRVVANIDAGYHTTPGAIRESLYLQVFNPVRWEECIRRMIGDGVREFYEVGPNRVLTGLLRKTDRSVRCTNVSRAADVRVATPA